MQHLIVMRMVDMVNGIWRLTAMVVLAKMVGVEKGGSKFVSM